MPLYEYISEDGKTKIEVSRPVKDRDKPIRFLRLKTVPEKVRVIGINSTVERHQNQGHDVLRGYYNQECKLGSRFKSEFSAETIKNAWMHDKL